MQPDTAVSQQDQVASDEQGHRALGCAYASTGGQILVWFELTFSHF
jgi:hypothetical protein